MTTTSKVFWALFVTSILIMMSCAGSKTSGSGPLPEDAPVEISLPYPSVLNDSTIEAVTKLLDQDRLDLVKQILNEADSAARKNHAGYLTAYYFYTLMKKAGPHYEEGWYAEALDIAQSFWSWRTARAHLYNLEKVPFQESDWSRFQNEEFISMMLSNYLLTYMQGRYTWARNDDSEDYAILISKILQKYPIKGVLYLYRNMIGCDHSIQRFDMAKAHVIYSRRDDAGEIDSCDSAFINVSDTFNPASMPILLSVTLKHSSAYSFDKNKTVLKMGDRLFGEYLGDARSVFTGFFGCAITLFEEDVERYWLDVAERLSGQKIVLKDGPITLFNPKFAEWVLKTLVPKPDQLICTVPAKEFYKKVFAKTLRLPALCLGELVKRGLPDEIKAYADAMSDIDFDGRTYLRERFQDVKFAEYTDSHFTSKYNDYLGFWLRRGISGNLNAFWTVYYDFLKLYDPEFAKSLKI